MCTYRLYFTAVILIIITFKLNALVICVFLLTPAIGLMLCKSQMAYPSKNILSISKLACLLIFIVAVFIWVNINNGSSNAH